MNFYKHYIGDFQRDTGHLSLTERGAYRALLDHHYATERPLPLDAVSLCRLVGAVSKVEREAVARILVEFWHKSEDGYINRRALREMGKADHQRDVNRQIAEAREARKKAAASSNESGTNRNNEQSTNRSTNDQPNQTPDTRHQTPDLKPKPSTNGTEPPEVGGSIEKIPDKPTDPLQWMRWMNAEHGTSYDPLSSRDRKALWPIFTAWVKAGITLQQIREAIKTAQATAKEPIASLPAYADRVLANSQAPAKTKPAPQWFESADGIVRKARELGIQIEFDERPGALCKRIDAHLAKAQEAS